MATSELFTMELENVSQEEFLIWMGGVYYDYFPQAPTNGHWLFRDILGRRHHTRYAVTEGNPIRVTIEYQVIGDDRTLNEYPIAKIVLEATESKLVVSFLVLDSIAIDWLREFRAGIYEHFNENNGKQITLEMEIDELIKACGVRRETVIMWKKIAKWIEEGLSEDQIADRLERSQRAVRDHKKKMRNFGLL